MNVLLSILLIVAAVVLLLKKHKPGAIVCIALMLVLASTQFFRAPTNANLADRFDTKTKEVMTRVFAQTIAERHPDKTIALIVLPEIQGLPESFLEANASQHMLVNAFAKRGIDVKEVPLPLPGGAKRNVKKASAAGGPDDIETFSEDAALMKMGGALARFDTRQLNRMLGDLRGEADVVVCTLPLASKLSASKLLAKDEGPALVLMLIDVDDVEHALETTVLDMCLGYRPDASWEIDYQWPKDDEEAFNARYVISTK